MEGYGSDGSVQPGMAVADLVEVVAPWLADRVLAGSRHGAHIAWMTVPKAVLRLLTPRYHRRVFFRGRLPSSP